MSELTEKQGAVLVELTEDQLDHLANQHDREYGDWYCAVCRKTMYSHDSHAPDCWVGNALRHLAKRKDASL